MNLENDYLTVKELSQWIRLSASKIYSLIDKNKIPFTKIGAKILFDREKIKNWLAQQSNDVK
jgi:excisionase family DNA binding protein